jgi:putative membrane protein
MQFVTLIDVAVTRSAHCTRALAWFCCALTACIIATGCGDTRQQKPKVGWSMVSIASAQQADRVVPPAAIAGVMQPVDETFALFAASSGMAELEGARFVLRTTSNADVRDYAQKLMRDHTRDAEELRRIVAPRGLKLPPAPTGRHADMVTKLSGLRQPELDEAFLQRFGIDAHKETIALFERHLTEGKDSELRRYAQQTLVTLREHMASAQKLLYAAAASR